MNITYKYISDNPGGASMKKLPHAQLSHATEHAKLSSFNNYKERPFNKNSKNLSFEGLSSYSGVEKAINNFGEEFGQTAMKYFEKTLKNLNDAKNSGLTLNGDNITFNEKNLGKRLVEVLLYPFKDMFLDMGNSVIKGITKLSQGKETTLVKKLNEIKPIKARKDAYKTESQVYAIHNYFQNFKNGKKNFRNAHSRLSLDVSNYDSTMDRTLTRLVTGAIPAFFLANDAYNLSMYMNNNKDIAKKEKKRRFNQEAVRIGITAAATFGVLKLFSKRSNGSAQATTYLLTGVTLISEFIGRWMVGTPVLPVSKNEAKKYAEKQGKIKNEEIESVKKGVKFAANSKDKEKSSPPEKGGLTFRNVFKILGALAVFGAGAEGLKHIPSLKKHLAKLSSNYKKLYTNDFKISREEFNKLIQKLKDNGFDKMAEQYENIVKDQNGNILKLGRTKDKVKTVIIHDILSFPIRFAWNSCIMLPYHLLQKIYKISKKILTPKTKNLTKINNKTINPKKEIDEDQKMLRNSIQYLRKIDKDSDYSKKVSRSLLNSLDNATKSNYSNAELSAAVKNSTSAVTSVFLVLDNYNMAMIDSRGEDKDMAEQKAKERTIQRAVRIAYGAMLVKFFNGLFSNTYNGSLLGAQGVNSLYAITTETLERTSVGLPLHESTREEMARKEKKNLEAKGFKGGYYRAMAKLTGKKPLAELENKENNK